MTCAHFTHVGEEQCAQGVNYMGLAGGGAFRMLLRLPCLPLSNRRGEEARMCAKYQPGACSAIDYQGEQQ
jgi:hypothetical protein